MSEPMGAPPLALAATVLLVRAAPVGAEEDYELFVVRRHSKSGFMGDAYVFPGGKLDPADEAPAMAARCRGLAAEEAARRLGEPSAARALALHIAALRESFEEAGALLAAGPDGALLTADPEPPAAMRAAREAIAADAGAFAPWLAAHGLTLALERLHVWAHWVTPPIERRRFDAHFFLAEVGADVALAHDRRETTDSVWLTPSDALRRHAAGEVVLAPPQLRSLIELQEDFPTLAALRVEAAARGPVRPIAPQPHAEGGALALLMPGDEAYTEAPGPSGSRHRAVLAGTRWSLVREGGWRI